MNVVHGPRSQTQGQRSPAQGRVFALTQEKVEEALNAMTGTLLLNSKMLAHVLFDTGASNSFIAKNFVCTHDLMSEDMERPILIATPLGKSLFADKVCKGCTLELGKWEYEVDLIILEMFDFDVILGMDWLFSNRVKIDCHERIIFSNPPGHEYLNHFGNALSMKISIVSALKAADMLKRGCKGYLASVVDKKQGELVLGDIPIVREYPEIFPEELPGLPTSREIEFEIVVEANTTPISKPPYRMAATELKELKVQL